MSQQVSGDNNIVAGTGDIHIDRIDIRHADRKSRQTIISGSVASEVEKHNYLQYLVARYNEFKRAEMGSEMKYGFIHGAYKRYMRCSIRNTPLTRFDDAVAWLQMRIRNTIFGKTQASKGNRLFVTFDEFLKGRDKPTGTH